jgi:hypothetical protein
MDTLETYHVYLSMCNSIILYATILDCCLYVLKVYRQFLKMPAIGKICQQFILNSCIE